MYVEVFCKKGKNQIDNQLSAEIDEHQGAEQGIRNAVHFTESNKQYRRQTENRRHRNISKITRMFCSFKIFTDGHIVLLSFFDLLYYVIRKK